MSLIDFFPNLLLWVDTSEDLTNLQFEVEVELLLNTTTQASYMPELPVYNLTPYVTPFDPEE